ncbi:MAG: SpoVA/SpoVAEb family sporulation membrane protein, partial [Lachnospiraceae bacterium]|nr:SpoVA/SpoVAEb family sporulation membrane protein [Lachnospiraceae bacterium]
MEINKKAYNAYVKEVTPVNNLWMDMGKAFLTGGVICVIAQGITSWLTGGLGLEKEAASAWTLIVLIGASVLATGLGWYPKLVKFGGAGALVPITGFANSVAAPAIENQVEGQVFGIGCKIFTIAGPV